MPALDHHVVLFFYSKAAAEMHPLRISIHDCLEKGDDGSSAERRNLSHMHVYEKIAKQGHKWR